MTAPPTDQLARRETRGTAQHLVFRRTFAAPVDDVWAACTEPSRMERWVGTWTGDPASGEVVFRMTAEGEGAGEEVWLVEVCEPPRRFVVRSRESYPFSEDGSGPEVPWELTLELAESDGVTMLTFTQVVPEGRLGGEVVSSVGPGWDYYLDRLVTSCAGQDPATVVWEPYLQRSDHYRGLFT